VAIPGDILNKPAGLTSEELRILENCPKIGYRMAQSLDEPQLAQLILALREHWDGRGYPNGLKGEQIPLLSRLVALVEAYDMMTHDRPYKSKVTPAEALAEIGRCSNHQFDPILVELFITHIEYITK
jgi:HD-GYP domain-containing protein (c-di-GMP phosphodiesterase class II)